MAKQKLIHRCPLCIVWSIEKDLMDRHIRAHRRP